MEVLQGNERRPVPCDAGEDLGDVEDEQPPASVCVARRRPAVLEAIGQGAPEQLERFGPQHRAAQVDEHGGRHLEVARIRAAPHGPEPGRGRAPFDRPEQPGLADPGFAREEEQAALAGCNLGDASIGKLQQVVPADQDRADEGPSAVHQPSLGAGYAPSSVG
jgi:hypothetical protein